MKLLSSDSYNVAWFKLADFVARGEKERALIVYKLLMHSVPDKAFSYQLEGDILLAFDDDAALEKYHLAANLYKKNKQLKEAAAVYEHAALFKEDVKILEALLDVHEALKNRNGIIETFSRFASLAVKGKDIGLLINRLHTFLIHKDDLLMAELYGQTVVALAMYDCDSSHYANYLEQALDLYVLYDEPVLMNKFLSKLKVTNRLFYQRATDHLAAN